MTNKEKYKQAFSTLHVSEEINLEVKKMADKGKKQKLTRMLAGAAACVLLLGGSVTAYAADVGGVQRTIQLWRHGDQTEVTIEFNADGSCGLEYLNKIGDYLKNPIPEVIYEDDGSVWIYYSDQKIDITNKFNDNVCYAQVSNTDETLYMTIKYQSGWSADTSKYPDPSTID